jgi:hypothetical protein
MYSQTFAEQPRFFFVHSFMHFWANDDALNLAKDRWSARDQKSGGQQEDVSMRCREREQSQRFQGVGR